MPRKLALLVLVLAALGAWLGRQPGRVTTRDRSSCLLETTFDYWKQRSSCVPERVTERRPAVDGGVSLALLVIALGAALVAAVPRRWAAGIWIGASASAAFLAFVVTRTWNVHAAETVALWPRHATWMLAAASAAALLGVFGWLLTPPAPRLPEARLSPSGTS